MRINPLMSQENDSFRDRPTNIDELGYRKWVYAKQPAGKWYTRRTIVGWGLLLFLIAVPFIRFNGHPLVLMDIAERKFIIFGAIFWAQDTFILSLLMLSFVLFIILFTVTYGRVWCGWACPQTIFLEMVFRRIEFWIEGESKKRRKMDAGPLTIEKIWKKALKHALFFAIAIGMTNIFLMWFIGNEKWYALIKAPVSENLNSFSIMLAVSGLFYWIYAFFREQVCTMVCPYGRMQGVLLDGRSIVVTYDYKRGEPRGGNAAGDCIDCRRCLAVCPTGIDIRNGTQFECIHCTACIDECNIVMKKMGRPPGLIRYDSSMGIENGNISVWNARNIAYSAVLALLAGFFVITLATRPSVETTILRTPGLLYQENNDNTISNVYNVKIVNKTHQDKELQIKVLSHKGRIELAGNRIFVEDQAMFQTTMLLFIPRKEITLDKSKVEFGIYDDGQLIETCKVTFVGP
jgi:cytochrome c oxidase accessory protein FixG